MKKFFLLLSLGLSLGLIFHLAGTQNQLAKKKTTINDMNGEFEEPFGM